MNYSLEKLNICTERERELRKEGRTNISFVTTQINLGKVSFHDRVNQQTTERMRQSPDDYIPLHTEVSMCMHKAQSRMYSELGSDVTRWGKALMFKKKKTT